MKAATEIPLETVHECCDSRVAGVSQGLRWGTGRPFEWHYYR